MIALKTIIAWAYNQGGLIAEGGRVNQLIRYAFAQNAKKLHESRIIYSEYKTVPPCHGSLSQLRCGMTYICLGRYQEEFGGWGGPA